jgi:predicted oxidoreductase
MRPGGRRGQSSARSHVARAHHRCSGLQTDLSGRVLDASGSPVPGLYAAGEVAGFGGGGAHGYRSLEGTFLGGCLFSGRRAGRAAAEATAT